MIMQLSELISEVESEKIVKGRMIDLGFGITKQKFTENGVTHVLFNVPNLKFQNWTEKEFLINKLSKSILAFIKNAKSILVVGLGNRHISSDSFGVKTASGVIATRGLMNLKREVSVVTPSVFGLTGIESAEMVKSIVKTVCPDVVVAIDTLCAIEHKNLVTNFQLSNGGFVPGAGVGNNRMEINENSVGVPVITIGVPFVVYAKSFVVDAINSVMQTTMQHGKNLDNMGVFNNLIKCGFDGLVLTVKDVEQCVKQASFVVYSALNLAFNNYSVQEQNLVLNFTWFYKI